MQIDRNILKSCIKNDRKAQQFLYKSCYNILMSVCIRYKKNEEDARALLNMGFLKILKNIKKYSKKVPFEAWIRKIMINTIIDEFRKNKKEKEMMDYKDFQDFDDNSSLIDYNEADKKFDANDLEMMIKLLPKVSQKVFNLYVIDGYNHREIGDMLNISSGTSKWHLSFARKKIKEMIKKSFANAKSLILWLIGV